MALPLNEVPNYTCKLPSTGQTITYRPFLVKEQKVMLMAMESENDKEIGQAVTDTMQSCIVSDLDIAKVPIYDFEYLYLKVRAKSVGETVKLRIKCPDDEKEIVEKEINIDKIEVDMPKDHTNKIEFEPGYGVIMNYPTINTFQNVPESTTALSFKLVQDSIQTIYKGDEVYDRNNISDKELEEFVNNMTQAQFTKVQTFFDTMPRVRHNIKYQNPKTGKDFEMNLTGTSDFF